MKSPDELISNSGLPKRKVVTLNVEIEAWSVGEPPKNFESHVRDNLGRLLLDVGPENGFNFAVYSVTMGE